MFMDCAGHWVTSSKKSHCDHFNRVSGGHGKMLPVLVVGPQACPLLGLRCRHEDLFHWRIRLPPWVPEVGATPAP